MASAMRTCGTAGRDLLGDLELLDTAGRIDVAFGKTRPRMACAGKECESISTAFSAYGKRRFEILLLRYSEAKVTSAGTWLG